MAIIELIGCVLITFGPPASLFLIIIRGNPLLIILLMASAFFWLLSLLFSSLIWFAAVPLRQTYIFGLIFSVILQEIFRFVFYFLLSKARKGLEVVSNQGQPVKKPLNMLAIYYVSGLGYGIVSGAFATVNVYKELNGPGTIGINGDSQYFFLISAFTTLAFIILQMFWGVVFMGSLDSELKWRKISGVVGVVASHLLVSGLTLLNQRSDSQSPAYAATLTISYIMTVVMGLWAYNIAAGSGRSLQHFVHPPVPVPAVRRSS